MKDKFLLFLTTILFSSSLHAQKTYVPDDNFEQKLINLGRDDILDDSVLTANIDLVPFIDVSSSYIEDLTGIEGFTNLKTLTCYNNFITTLNISNNLELETLQAGNNQISNIDLSNNLNLKLISLKQNNLSEIDVSNNVNLEVLSIAENELSQIDVSNNLLLSQLWCGGNNLLEIDVSNNQELVKLKCDDNNIMNINLTSTPSITSLSINNNPLENLEIADDSKFFNLSCSNTLLTNLDLSNTFRVYTLNCFDSKLVSLNLANGNTDGFENIRVQNNPNLYCIQVDDTSSTEIDDYWLVYTTRYKFDSHHFFSEDCDVFIGMNEITSNSFDTYPNPFSNILNVEVKDNISYTVKSVLGRYNLQSDELNKGNHELDLSHLDNGIYMFQITNEQGLTTTKKIIKQ